MMNTSNTFYGSGNSMSNTLDQQLNTTTSYCRGLKSTKDYAKPLKLKTCRICKTKFQPTKPFQSVCGIDCSIAVALKTRDKIVKAQDKVKREKLKSRSDWLKEAQTAFNAYVRQRDINQPCICCGKPLTHDSVGGGYDCGHYRSVGSAPHLRFNENNAHAQTKQCNRWGAGRAVDYRIGLIARIGLQAVEALECDTSTKKYTIDDLKAIKSLYNAKLKELKACNT
jgi:hypothetical protein